MGIIVLIIHLIMWIIAGVLFYGVADNDELEAMFLGLIWFISLPIWGISELIPWLSDKIFKK